MPRNSSLFTRDVANPRIVRGASGLIALLALLLSGCAGDSLSGPGSDATPWGGLTVSRGPAGVPRPDVIVHHVADDSASAEFTVTPSGGVFSLGPHAIYFPPNSICNPGSSYGPTEWDAPCEQATDPIRFRAEVRSLDGRSWVDFTPAVRFVPSADDANGVWLYMKTSAISADADVVRDVLRRMAILYSPAIGVDGVNEALADPSLRTYVWLDGGIAFRRIKHFSGYNIHDGFSSCGERTGLELENECDGGLSEVGELIVRVVY
jgi:hypothetical protein